MKLIILRHAKRYSSPGFDIPLTSEGFEQADALIEKIEGLNLYIDEVYCSPFLRTMQTIYPYCKRNNIKINIENSLYEVCHKPFFDHTNYRNSINDLHVVWKYIYDIINFNYRSYFNVSNIKINPHHVDITNRVNPFIYSLLKKNKNRLRERKKSEKVILLVTHKSICNAIKKYFDKSVNISDDFDMGAFEIIDINDADIKAD
jgi:broad specificity phosphatase PhoE